ncbi:MAG TPA: 4Fe-4S dicluster domain-containing protein [Saprospiraceae bacterium]|nr:4Fe-4S dicluster domain-containing protein [Saprospiraceae bacterium]
MKNDTSKNVWIGTEDLLEEKDFAVRIAQEFQPVSLTETLSDERAASTLEGSRRDFLKFLGFGLGAATIAAGCDIPVKRAIPYVVKPEEIVPGVATYYASTYSKGGDYCAVLVKTREGRPIKIEGNDLSKVTKGGTSARSQASVLELYDTHRFRQPMIDQKKTSWSDLDSEVIKELSTARKIRILGNTNISPSANAVIAAFSDAFNDVEYIQYDTVSYAGLLDANEECFGERIIPDYHFEKAELIVGLGADFLGTWISPVEYARKYAKGRRIKDLNNPKMSRHVQIESGMSLTGSNADNRILIKPSEQGAATAYLHMKITGGGSSIPLNEKATKALDRLAAQLKEKAGKSLIVSGSNNKGEQILINAINHSLGNYGNTITWKNASLQRQGSDLALSRLVEEMKSGSVDALIILDANPVYDSGYGEEFSNAMANVKTTIACSFLPSETTTVCKYIAAIPHFLESWGDAHPKKGHYSLVQPTIAPLFDTRQYELSLLKWGSLLDTFEGSDQPYYDFLRNQWKKSLFSHQNDFASFTNFWDHCLHDGVVYIGNNEGQELAYNGDDRQALTLVSRPSTSDLEISFYESVSMGNGEFSTNPWLLEMPDPVLRTTWGNYLAVPVSFDGVRKFLGYKDLKDGDLVDVTIGDQVIQVPVMQQFGQMPGTVSLSLGYGRREAGFAGTGVGEDVNHLLTFDQGYRQYFHTHVMVSGSKGKEKYFSSVQYHHTFGVQAEDKKTGEKINADEAATVYATYGIARQGYQGFLTDRSIIYNSHINDLPGSLEHMHERRKEAQHLNEQQIYKGYDYLYEQGHHWGMHVDLNACIGCGACTVACMAENNVPVVGKREVSRHHEMTWLRIDRYYYGDAENPNTVYQPMMCQHCDNAPCENVCPVNATNHSSEGLNQMTYNRCVGTRYCANNCPYKVRRFNWSDYTTADIFPANQVPVAGESVPYGADNLTRMVLNPDVTVRARGVIEKCSFCVQRIQEGKLLAKNEGRRLEDRDVRSACQTACPTGAITFGDMNNAEGQLTKKLNSPLNYIVLEEVNVRSSVEYSMKVNNRDESMNA